MPNSHATEEVKKTLRRNPGMFVYIAAMAVMLGAVFVYEEQRRQEDREFTQRVCRSLEEYRVNSNVRRSLVQGYLIAATEERKKNGPPLTAQEKQQAKTLIEGFSDIPELADCDTGKG